MKNLINISNMLLKWHYQLEKKSWHGCYRNVLNPGILITKDKQDKQSEGSTTNLFQKL